MDERDFGLFLSAVKGKSLAEIRGAEIERVLKELLAGEFAEVKETKFKVMLKKPSGGGLASINKVEDQVYIWVDPENWKHSFSKEIIRSLMRHELLHLELGLMDDADPRFKQAARERGISIWNV